MKTTLDIPDSLLRQVKARSALNGTSMRDFFVEVIEARLEADQRQEGRPRGWLAVFGKAPKGASARVQTVIDKEFENVQSEDWK